MVLDSSKLLEKANFLVILKVLLYAAIFPNTYKCRRRTLPQINQIQTSSTITFPNVNTAAAPDSKYYYMTPNKT